MEVLPDLVRQPGATLTLLVLDLACTVLIGRFVWQASREGRASRRSIHDRIDVLGRDLHEHEKMCAEWRGRMEGKQ